MSLFKDVTPGQQATVPRRGPQKGAGFDSIFVRLPLAFTRLLGQGVLVLVSTFSNRKRKVYYKSGPSWRKWPW